MMIALFLILGSWRQDLYNPVKCEALIIAEAKTMWDKVGVKNLDELGPSVVEEHLLLDFAYANENEDGGIGYIYDLAESETLALTILFFHSGSFLARRGFDFSWDSESVCIERIRTEYGGDPQFDETAWAYWDETKWKNTEDFWMWLGIPRKRWTYILE